MADLRRIPDDLYDLAVSELLELRTQRDALARQVRAAEAHVAGDLNDTDTTVERAMAALGELSERLTSVDPRIAREALRTVFDRVDLTFEHVQHAKQVRSHFKRGVARLKSYSDGRAHQGAELSST